jgi:hypothetical protein
MAGRHNYTLTPEVIQCIKDLCQREGRQFVNLSGWIFNYYQENLSKVKIEMNK